MKRVLIRLSALATVVILGVIAIAQAQRSANQSTAVAGGSDTTSSSPPASRQDPFASTSSSEIAAPRPLTLPSRVNPLRPEPSSDASPEIRSASRYRSPLRETSDSRGRAEPLVLSDRDRTTVKATSGTGEMLGSGPDASEKPEATPASSPRFPTPSTTMPANARSNRLTLGDTPPADGVQGPATPAANRPAIDPWAANAADNSPAASVPTTSSPAAGEPSRLRTDPFSRSLGEPQASAMPPATERENTILGSANAPDPSALNDNASLGVGTGTPGNKQLEGTQTPQVTIEKLAPPEIQVGKPATFHIRVRNTGKVAAHGVEIHDEIPKGTRLMSTNPQASQGVRGEMIWSLGTMQPGDEVTAELQVMPVEEGDIGSVATVRFNAEASARTRATKPELVVETSAPNRILVGETLTLSITVTNPGSGVATGVVLEERIPAGLQHPAGTELEYDIGDLKPKESRKLQLQLVAERPGQVTNVLVGRGDVNLKAEHRLDIQVQAPQLDLAVEGPKRRYLEREAAYTVAISNPGTAPAQRVELIAQLPAGLKFVSANNAGHYNEADRTVHWQLDELPVQETGTVKLVTMPVQPGEHKLLVSASADKATAAEREQPVLIEGIAAIMFEIVDVNDPVEKGGETTYEIRVVNQGSKAATNVQLAVNLPAGMRVLAAEGPTHQSVTGNRIVFEGLSRLAPKADTTYRIRVQCLQAGDLRVQAQLFTNEMREPVTKEESTRVYADE